MFPNLLSDIRADGLFTLDVQIKRQFALGEALKFSLSVDMMNATNHTNFAAPNIDPTSTDFGRVTAAIGAGRQLQLNLRLDW